MNTDVNAPVIIVDEIEVIKNDFDRTEGTTDSYTGTLRYVVVTPVVFLSEFIEVIDLCCFFSLEPAKMGFTSG
ncbi:hypothetical protein T02_485 [Trichinella nativa]|uniref:Uncharacterized protein n=1 Tax=Trichinella nativa TaxID=6335 RepID=A0A0V1LGN4_9BILA|nr:hypothetical protein T02_485 [Trichinella nativa]